MSAVLETFTVGLAVGCDWAGQGALPETVPHFGGENKLEERGNLTPSLANFPNTVCAHGNKQGRAEI